jgi:V-type H+-transporting ATPase S1 subunit
MKLLSTLLVLGTVFVASTHCDKVPVFLWGTKTTIHTPALKTHDSENFNNFLRKQISDDAVTVVFFENNLSTQDLTQCKNAEGTSCFQYLNSIKSSSYLPSVENPIETMELYHEGNQLLTHLNTDGSFNMNFNDIGKGDIIFFPLADGHENENPAELFSRHDDLMRKFVEKLSPEFEVVGIYTGNHAPIVHSLQKREVNANETEVQPIQQDEEVVENPKTFSNERVLMYFTRLYYTTADSKIDLDVTSMSLGGNTSVNTIQIILHSGEDLFSFEINERASTYHLENVVFNSLRMRHEQISVNLPFSFHCGPGVIFRSKQSDVIVVWQGLQIEPQFNRTSFNGSYFSESWDCVGFTSGGVWMGLVITFLLLSILSCGFAWMFDIKTMDRFDDPKGKTITVTEME